jgi:hypothetical protein
MKIPIQKIQTQYCCNLAATKKERERKKNKKTNTEYLEVKKKKKKGVLSY